MVNEGTEALFLKISLHRMCSLYFVKMKEVLKGLSSEQLWTEPYRDGNTVGGIVLHVCEHIARNCLRLKGLEHELKSNFENYFPLDRQTAEELITTVENQLNIWKIIINDYIENESSIDKEHIHQLYHLVEHTSYHLGQIIDRVQGMTGHKFSFCKNGVDESYLRSKIESNEA